jgi:hypothetical protein
MTTIIMSSDTNPHLRRAYRQYVRLQRRTPSGQLYDSVSMIERDGTVFTYTALLTPAGDRTRRCLCRCDGGPRRVLPLPTSAP